MHKKELYDPKLILAEAIEALDVFTEPDASRIELQEDGRLVAAKESRMGRVIALARDYIGPLFSDSFRKEQQKKQQELKRALLRARDNIQRHSALIERYKDGDPAQRKLAEMALRAIERYNTVVVNSVTQPAQPETYNYDRHLLLLDQEIKGQPIELPVTYIKNYDSHSHVPQSAFKTLQGLSLVLAGKRKCGASLSPTHKKNEQFLVDTFHIKAIGLIKNHLTKPFAEIVSLVKQGSPDIIDRSGEHKMTMQQLIKVDAGEWIMVTGSFQRRASHPEAMTMLMPMMETFRLYSQKMHTGFPYPSQYIGWALAEQWIEAAPLRPDQTPLFHQLNQRRKRLAHRLLTDEPFIEKVRRYAKFKREVFDQHKDLFLSLHRRLHAALQKEMKVEGIEFGEVAFYEEASSAPSLFDFFSHTQQQLLDLFIRQPVRALEESWLSAEVTPLRIGTSSERLAAAASILEQPCLQADERSDVAGLSWSYAMHLGRILNKAFHSVGMQYQSEKMGFAPPLLKAWERKLQACAFSQLSSFLDECEKYIDSLNPEEIKSRLVGVWLKMIEWVESDDEDEGKDPVFDIVNELEYYFNSRFYTPSS